MNPGIATKELARRTLIPIPLATAIKKELIREGMLMQDRGVRCTLSGENAIEEQWGYRGLNKELYLKLMANDSDWTLLLQDMMSGVQNYFLQRPQADVQIDQSKCTAETSMKRAILCLKQHALIGKRILCVGDDDLVSVSIGLLLKRLFPAGGHTKTSVTVVDIDKRFLDYIGGIAVQEQLSIECLQHDLRQPVPDQLCGQYDCFFTDPPYTLQGMSLFLSRGILALKRSKGQPVFLSFAHQPPESMLAMQREFIRMGLTVGANYPRFNTYEGAEMIANHSQMFVLRTTDKTAPEYMDVFADALYTGEVKRTIRTYQCKTCHSEVLVGAQLNIPTIEQLKNRGCPSCGSDTFDLIRKTNANPDSNKN